MYTYAHTKIISSTNADTHTHTYNQHRHTDEHILIDML